MPPGSRPRPRRPCSLVPPCAMPSGNVRPGPGPRRRKPGKRWAGLILLESMACVPNPRFLGEPWFWLKTSLPVGTIVLHLTLSGLILLCIAGTVYYEACNTLGIEEL